MLFYNEKVVDKKGQKILRAIFKIWWGLMGEQVHESEDKESYFVFYFYFIMKAYTLFFLKES